MMGQINVASMSLVCVDELSSAHSQHTIRRPPKRSKGNDVIMRSGPAIDCIMSNLTTHHHLGGPIRVNEVSSTAVRLLIKNPEVEKKTLLRLRSLVRLLT